MNAIPFSVKILSSIVKSAVLVTDLSHRKFVSAQDVQLRYPAKEEQLFLAKAPLGRVIASIGDRIENVKKVKFSSAG